MPQFAPVQMPHHGNVPHGVAFRVPWRIHVKAWEKYHKHFSGQSAERIAERGGFGLEELIFLLAGENPFAVPREDWPLVTDFFGRWPPETEEQKP